MFFLPKKSKIFDDLVKQSVTIQQAAEVFNNLATDFKKSKKCGDELESLEQRGDEYVHKITDAIEESFILSLDKEDIKGLTEILDDVLDNLEQTASRIRIYKLTKSTEVLQEFSETIVQTVDEIHKGMVMIQKRHFFSDDFTAVYKRLHDLENKGDMIHRRALVHLMGKTKASVTETLLIVKWKEIYQTLEDTLDRCEDIAIVFERLRIKYR